MPNGNNKHCEILIMIKEIKEIKETVRLLAKGLIDVNKADEILLGLFNVSVSLPAERFDAEDFLNTKDIYNHPIITDRENVNGYEVADLMAEFVNKYNSNER